MVASVQSPADLVNVALVRIGFKDRVADLFEGSDQAKNTLDIYGQTRDELLRQFDWGFSERNIALTLLKSAPVAGYFAGWDPTVNPPVGYRFSYAYPGDCLKVRAVKPTPIFFPELDPQPYVYTIANDALLQQKVILCNVPNALMVYTGQVVDPQAWESDFVEAFASALGRRLAAVLMGMDAEKIAVQDEAVAIQTAEPIQG